MWNPLSNQPHRRQLSTATQLSTAIKQTAKYSRQLGTAKYSRQLGTAKYSRQLGTGGGRRVGEAGTTEIRRCTPAHPCTLQTGFIVN